MTRYQKGALLRFARRQRRRIKGSKRGGREFLSLFLRVVDIRTRIRHLVE